MVTMPEGWQGIDGAVAEARLRGLRRRLSELDVALADQQVLARSYPSSFAISLSGESLRSMERSLRQELVETLRHRKAEHISIALDGPSFSDHSAKLADLGVVITRMQRLYSSVGQAIATGPTRRGQIASEVIGRTTLRLSASYPSSFGLNIIVPSNYDLLGASLSVDALDQMFKLLHSAENDAELMRTSGETGRRALVHLRHLAVQLQTTNSVMTMNWKDFSGTRYHWSINSEAATRLIRTIDNIKEIRSETKTSEGLLVGASLLRHRFEILLTNNNVVEGKFVSGLSSKIQDLFGAEVSALLDETEVLDRASGEAKTYYTLRDLDKVTSADSSEQVSIQE